MAAGVEAPTGDPSRLALTVDLPAAPYLARTKIPAARRRVALIKHQKLD
jgi:hypothetical protein